VEEAKIGVAIIAARATTVFANNMLMVLLGWCLDEDV
jgi:hypothetical protein